MESIPFYLRADYQTPGITEVPLVDLGYDYTKNAGVPAKSTSLWQDIADSADSGVNVVFDKANGAWKEIKSTTQEVLQAPLTAAQGLLDSVKENILWIAVVGLIIIIVVARTGILTQVAGLIK